MQINIEIDPRRNSALGNGFAAADIVIPELDIRERLFLPYEKFHRYCGARETLVDDFLFASAICYSIDLLISRKSATDNWTRDLTVEIPVRDPDLWNSQAELFTEILTFLTGDKWRISFGKRVVSLYIHRKKRRRIRRWPADTVCLFSGGLDSFLGAIEHLSTTTGHVALVGHYDVGLARSTQLELFDSIQTTFGTKRVHLFQGRIGFDRGRLTGKLASNPEPTQRSRSLLYIALGVYIAHQQGKDREAPLLIPENGFISLNPPLTSSRLGSCSTRTVHPYFLGKLQELLDNLGLHTQVLNPFAGRTKGEALVTSPHPELVKSLACRTVSCAHPTRRQNWNRRDVTHCGYCVPCLIRRSALNCAGIDDGTDYGIDVLAGELGIYEDILADFRAILMLLYTWHSDTNAVQQVVNRLVLPEGWRTQAETVIEKQLRELDSLISTKATQRILQWAGLS